VEYSLMDSFAVRLLPSLPAEVTVHRPPPVDFAHLDSDTMTPCYRIVTRTRI
jgi:hypothetical protein